MDRWMYNSYMACYFVVHSPDRPLKFGIDRFVAGTLFDFDLLEPFGVSDTPSNLFNTHVCPRHIWILTVKNGVSPKQSLDILSNREHEPLRPHMLLHTE